MDYSSSANLGYRNYQKVTNQIMVKKAILAIALIGIGCIGVFVFFVGYEEDQKMSQDTSSEEPSVEQKAETKDVRIYWTNRSGRIRRIRSDNSDIENLFTDVCSPIGIALDTSGDQMYWTSGCKIQRANFNGSNVEELVPSSEGIKGRHCLGYWWK